MRTAALEAALAASRQEAAKQQAAAAELAMKVEHLQDAVQVGIIHADSAMHACYVMQGIDQAMGECIAVAPMVVHTYKRPIV